MISLPAGIEAALAMRDPARVLAAALEHFGCQAGTVHRVSDGALRLAAHHGIPAPVVQLVETVPIGKGIAGLAAERREPITICNLQTDSSGQARPGAKATGMEGSLAVPILVEDDLRGVLGVAKATAYDWPEEEKELLLAVGSAMGTWL
ncbi:MAG: histidine kinase [Chthoniobacter sp.]|jgi:L-methionine (R)-S-oxide reductase|nr:histidine kinase [Chthoniobacter sp.]